MAVQVWAVEQRRPTQAETDLLLMTLETRARDGIPLESGLLAGQAAFRDAWYLGRRVVEREGLSKDVLFDFLDLLWDMQDYLTGLTLGVWREVETQQTRLQERRASLFLNALTKGRLEPEQLERHANALGLSLDAFYHPFRSRASEADLNAVERAVQGEIERLGATAIVGILDGDVAGISSVRPTATGVPAPLAVGPPSRLDGIASSFEVATAVLDAAVALGKTGVCTLEDLSLKMIAASSDHLADSLVARRLGAVTGAGETGEVLLETLHSYLQNRANVVETAEAIHVHPNTVRYRLDRFRELSGTSLDGMEDLFELWVALERYRMRKSGP
jgi:putative transposase